MVDISTPLTLEKWLFARNGMFILMLPDIDVIFICRSGGGN